MKREGKEKSEPLPIELVEGKMRGEGRKKEVSSPSPRGEREASPPGKSASSGKGGKSGKRKKEKIITSLDRKGEMKLKKGKERSFYLTGEGGGEKEKSLPFLPI